MRPCGVAMMVRHHTADESLKIAICTRGSHQIHITKYKL